MPDDLRGTGIWPKELPPLTDDQLRIRSEFMARWLEVLPGRYGVIERFNHGFPLPPPGWHGRTLEIGAGLGAHLHYEDLSTQEYFAVELRDELARDIEARFPGVSVAVADCQERLPYEDGSFDRVIAIHVLEHLTDLPAALDEVARVLSPTGTFSAVIPCEGGLAYSLAREISAKRIFEREFGMPYEWLIRSEHVNVPWEIVGELRKRFDLSNSTYFPLRLPWVWPNLVIGLHLSKRHASSSNP